MFPTVDNLLTLGNVPLALGDLEFTVDDVVDARAMPARWSERVLFDDLLDHGLRRKGNGLVHGRRHTRCAGLRNNTTGGTDEELRLATGNLCLTLSNGVLAGDELLSTLGVEVAQDAGRLL